MAKSLLTEKTLESHILFTDQDLVDGEGEIQAKVTDAINIEGANQVQLLADFTAGDSDGVLLTMEFSENQEDWFQETMISEYPTSNLVTHTLISRKIVANGKYRVSIPVSDSYMRVTATALTDGTDAMLSLTATVANI